MVYLYLDREKGKCRSHYIVTNTFDNHITIQKFKSQQLRAKEYKVKYEDIYKVKEAQFEPDTDNSGSDDDETSEITIKLYPPENETPPVEHQEVLETPPVEHQEVPETPPVKSQESREEMHNQNLPENSPCPICEDEVDEEERAIQCHQCKFWFHIGCCGISTKRYDQLMAENEEIPWFCPEHRALAITPKKGNPPGFRRK